MPGKDAGGDTSFKDGPEARRLIYGDYAEICEWCKLPVLMMVQKGTGVCSQQCAHYASHILFSTEEKAQKYGGGYAPEPVIAPEEA